MTYSSPSRTARHCNPARSAPGLRLSESQREGDFTADDAGQELLLLLFRAGGQDGRRAGAGAAHGDARAGEFLFDDVLVDAAAALSAVFFRPGDADPAPLGDSFIHLAGFGAAAANAGVLQLRHDFRGYVFCDELLDFGAERFLFRGECKFHNDAAFLEGCSLIVPRAIIAVCARAVIPLRCEVAFRFRWFDSANAVAGAGRGE